MRKKRRKGRVTTETSVEDEIVHLRGLDLKGLRARWQSVLQRPAPDHLPRHLLFAIIAYRIQADRFGDLDHETRQLLDRTGAKESGMAMSARLVSFDQKRTGYAGRNGSSSCPKDLPLEPSGLIRRFQIVAPREPFLGKPHSHGHLGADRHRTNRAVVDMSQPRPDILRAGLASDRPSGNAVRTER